MAAAIAPLLVSALAPVLPELIRSLRGSGALVCREEDLEEIIQEMAGSGLGGRSPFGALSRITEPFAKAIAPVAAKALSEVLTQAIQGRSITPAGGAMMPMGAVGSAMMPMGAVGSAMGAGAGAGAGSITPAGGIAPLIPIAASLAPVAIDLISRAIKGKGPVAFKRLSDEDQARVAERAAMILQAVGADPEQMDDAKLAKVGRGVMVARGGIRAGSGGLGAANFGKLLKTVKSVAKTARKTLSDPAARRIADATASILSSVGVPGVQQAAMQAERLAPVVDAVLGAVDDGSLSSAATAVGEVAKLARPASASRGSGSGNGSGAPRAGARFVFE